MGNGAVPNGLNYRAHPRLYLRVGTNALHFTSGFGVRQTRSIYGNYANDP